MIINLSALAFAATLLSSNSLVAALSASEVDPALPVSVLITTGDQHLAKGEKSDALSYYDVAISKDPQNYLTVYKRGLTYSQMGRTAQATKDFDTVLSIRPGFEGALKQRGTIRAMGGEWDAARKDYLAHGNSAEALVELEEAQGAATLATIAEKSGNWEECVTQSSVAIMVASKLLSLRKTRVHCRFEKGEVEEGMNDLKHVLVMQSGLTEPHVQISAIQFYALTDLEKGMDQVRKCLHSDPESKTCKKLYRREKTLDKQLKQINQLFDRKKYASAIKLLLPNGEDVGLVQDLKDDIKELKEAGTIPEKSPNEFVSQVVERVCEAYHEMNNFKKSAVWCEEALTYNEHSLPALLQKAAAHMIAENFEAAISSLNTAKEHHPGAQQIQQLLNTAHMELKRSKTKDYYKVLNLPRDADELQIKGAYRRMVKQHHPDKAHKQGISKEDAEKKMAQVNEAYEVLSDPALKERFDRGDDPNDHSQQGHNPFQQGGNPFNGFAGHQHSGGNQFNFKFGGGNPFG